MSYFNKKLTSTNACEKKEKSFYMLALLANNTTY